MPLIRQNSPEPQIVFVLPEISFPHNAAAGPDLNSTPFGRDFHWRKTFDRTVSCGIMQYLKVVNDNQKDVPATLVQLGSAYDAPTKPSKNGCLVSVMRTLDYFWNGPHDADVADAVAYLLSKKSNCKDSKNVFNAREEDRNFLSSSMFNPKAAGEWDLWTTDFLSRQKEKVFVDTQCS